MNPSTQQHVLLIMNPASGQKDFSHTKERLEERLKQANLDYTLRVTQGAGDAQRWAEQTGGTDKVIVAGGDGTVVEAISGLIGRSTPLGQIPTGTANLLAAALGIPSDPVAALDLALDGEAVPLDIGYIPEYERHFTLMASTGWHADLIEDTSRGLKNRLGFVAYVLSGIRNLFSLRRSALQIDCDGETSHVEAHTVLAINIGAIGGGLNVDESIDPHDGLLNIAVVGVKIPWKLARLLTSLVRQRAGSSPDVRFFSAQRVHLDADPPMLLQLDGEVLGETPFTVEVVPGGAQMIVPKSYFDTYWAQQEP